MLQLQARRDWLESHAVLYPEWKSIVERVIEMNAFIVIPAKYGWKDGGVKDGDLLVQEEGVKGPPCAFRMESGQVVCVNYPGSLKPMTPQELLDYIEKIMCGGFSERFVDWFGRLLRK